MNFSQAIEYLIVNKPITRKSWFGKMSIIKKPHKVKSINTNLQISAIQITERELKISKSSGDMVDFYVPVLKVGDIEKGYIANYDDFLADDWELANENQI